MTSRTSAYTYTPFNVWQQQGRPVAHPPPAPSGADREGESGQESVQHHLSRVASHSKSKDVQLDRARDELERKTRQCADLERQVDRHKGYVEQLKERLSQEVTAVRGELEDMAAKKQSQHDADRRQMSDLLISLRSELADAKRELQDERAARDRVVSQHSDAVSRVMAERDRVAEQAEAYHKSNSRRLNEAVVELAQLRATAAEYDREAAEKDSKLLKAQQETASMREHLESVARELVSRNRAGEEEAQRKSQEWANERQQIMTELAGLAEDKKDWFGERLKLKEELLVLKAHWDKAQAHGEERSLAASAAEARIAVMEQEAQLNGQEVRDLTDQIATLRQECDSLHEARERLDRELRRATEECTRCDEQLGSLRDELHESSDELTTQQRERSMFAAKVGRGTESVQSEVRTLAEAIDGLRGTLAEHLAAEERGLPPAQPLPEDSFAAGAAAPGAPAQHVDELTATNLLTRVRDEVIAAVEDLRTVRADVADELARARDLARQHKALQDAYVVGREHWESLTTSLNEANAAYARLAADKAVLEEGYADHDKQMAEAAALCAQRTEQQEAMLAEVTELRAALQAKEDASTESVLREQEKRMATVREESAVLAAECTELRREKLDAADRAQQHDVEMRRLTAQLEALHADVRQAELQREEALARAAKAEGEHKFLEQHKESSRGDIAALRSHATALEDENRKLRQEQSQLKAAAASIQNRLKDLEDAQRLSQAGQEAAAQRLAAARSTASAMQDSRDAAERRMECLEDSEQRMHRDNVDLRKDVETLWHALQVASKESDVRAQQIADLQSGSPRRQDSPRHLSPGPSGTAAQTVPLLRSPVSAPRSLVSVSPGRGDGSDRLRRLQQREDRLKSIEERVSGLLASRMREMDHLSRTQ